MTEENKVTELTRTHMMLFRRLIADEYIESGYDAKGDEIRNAKAYISRTIENASYEYDHLQSHEKAGMLQYIKDCIKNKDAGRQLRDFDNNCATETNSWDNFDDAMKIFNNRKNRQRKPR